MRLPRPGTAVPVVGLGVKGAGRRGAPRCAVAPRDTRSPLDLGRNSGIGWDAPLQGVLPSHHRDGESGSFNSLIN